MAVERIIELGDVRIVIWWCASSIMRCVREIRAANGCRIFNSSLSHRHRRYIISGAVVETYASHQVTCSSSSRTSHIAPSFFILSSRHDVHRMPVRKRRVGFAGTKKRHDWIGARVEGSKDIRIFIVRFAMALLSTSTRAYIAYNFFLMRYKAEYP